MREHRHKVQQMRGDKVMVDYVHDKTCTPWTVDTREQSHAEGTQTQQTVH